MKLHEKKSSEKYICGVCNRQVNEGEFHHNHDNFLNGLTWGYDAIKKQQLTTAQKLQRIAERKNKK